MKPRSLNPVGVSFLEFEADLTSTRSSTSRLSIKSPLRGVRKLKNMQCKITLLDGSDYTMTVDVSTGGG